MDGGAGAGGFDFGLCARYVAGAGPSCAVHALTPRRVRGEASSNAALERGGLQPPKAVKTGTTIVGLVFKVPARAARAARGRLLGSADGPTMHRRTASCSGPTRAPPTATSWRTSSAVRYTAWRRISTAAAPARRRTRMYGPAWRPRRTCRRACSAAERPARTQHTTDLIASQLELHRLTTGRTVRVVTACQMLKQMLWKYQGHVGVALVLGGVDSRGPALYSIYPHGSTDWLPYVTMGSGSLAAMTMFETFYQPNMERDAAMRLARDAVRGGIFNDLGSGSNVDLCVITKDGAEDIRPYEVANVRPPRILRIAYPRGTTGASAAAPCCCVVRTSSQARSRACADNASGAVVRDDFHGTADRHCGARCCAGGRCSGRLGVRVTAIDARSFSRSPLRGPRPGDDARPARRAVLQSERSRVEGRVGPCRWGRTERTRPASSPPRPHLPVGNAACLAPSRLVAAPSSARPDATHRNSTRTRTHALAHARTHARHIDAAGRIAPCDAQWPQNTRAAAAMKTGRSLVGEQRSASSDCWTAARCPTPSRCAGRADGGARPAHGGTETSDARAQSKTLCDEVFGYVMQALKVPASDAGLFGLAVRDDSNEYRFVKLAKKVLRARADRPVRLR